ncbi:hypothetical protein FOE78_18840 [Microlunatus elymi]|uniref:Uncharacterized protein n=1 Tax=Microlunatus elymi TaxID=2596828 RepID=A0A516Q3A6_9ACTN|nr:hypothetical protein [Microlunatus elymi]QDP97691.1 hypothetical protein FOE78_18840 [Microlunatus elymi]
MSTFQSILLMAASAAVMLPILVLVGWLTDRLLRPGSAEPSGREHRRPPVASPIEQTTTTQPDRAEERGEVDHGRRAQPHDHVTA